MLHFIDFIVRMSHMSRNDSEISRGGFIIIFTNDIIFPRSYWSNQNSKLSGDKYATIWLMTLGSIPYSKLQPLGKIYLINAQPSNKHSPKQIVEQYKKKHKPRQRRSAGAIRHFVAIEKRTRDRTACSVPLIPAN